MAVFVPPGECPNCGEFVPARAPSCPYCGADAQTAWSDETAADGLDLPGTDEPYERIAEREFGAGRPRGARAWWAFGLAVLLALVLAGLWWTGR
jgi:hypothetical protein